MLTCFLNVFDFLSNPLKTDENTWNLRGIAWSMYRHQGIFTYFQKVKTDNRSGKGWKTVLFINIFTFPQNSWSKDIKIRNSQKKINFKKVKNVDFMILASDRLLLSNQTRFISQVRFLCTILGSCPVDLAYEASLLFFN